MNARALAVIVAVLLPAPAAADLYATEIDGVVHITSKRPKRGKILYKLGDDARPKRRAKRRGRVAPARRSEFTTYVARAAEAYALPEALIWAVMRVESGFNPDVISHKGAQGLMQLMPTTGEEMGVTDPFDPEQNIYGGARYLRILANRFDGDLVLTLSGYHAGGGAVQSAGGIPYEQTAQYVRMVLNNYYRYQSEPPVGTAR